MFERDEKKWLEEGLATEAHQGDRTVRSLHRGFTLVELLVVIAIIGVLVALLLPAVQSAREAARRSSCLNNMRNVCIGILNYEDTNGELPPGRLGCDSFTIAGNPCEGKQIPISGFWMILPFVEQSALFNQMTTDVDDLQNILRYAPENDQPLFPPWFNRAENKAVANQKVQLYRCPSDSGLDAFDGESYPAVMSNRGVFWGTGSYAFCQGDRGPTCGGIAWENKVYNTGAFGYKVTRELRHFEDGVSNTILIGEGSQGSTDDGRNRWLLASRYTDSMRVTHEDSPLNMPLQDGPDLSGSLDYISNGAFRSDHPGGGNFGFGDASVTFVSDDIDTLVYRALGTIAGPWSFAGEPDPTGCVPVGYTEALNTSLD